MEHAFASLLISEGQQQWQAAPAGPACLPHTSIVIMDFLSLGLASHLFELFLALCRSKFPLAASLLAGTVQGRGYDDFLTTACYAHIVEPAARVVATTGGAGAKL